MRIAVFCADPVIGEALSCLCLLLGGMEVAFCSTNLATAPHLVDVEKPNILVVTEHFADDESRVILKDIRQKTGVRTMLLHAGADSEQSSDDVFDVRQSRMPGVGALIAALRKLDSDRRSPLSAAAVPTERNHATGQPPAKKLTPREYETALLVARGHTNPQIAAILAISEPTVKIVVSKLLRSFDCDNRIQLALRVLESFPPPEKEKDTSQGDS